MGGIFGVASTDPSFSVSPTLKAMAGPLRREGGEPVVEKSGPGFGAGALVQFPRWQAVEQQADGLIVAADAEIYNRRELEALLETAAADPPTRIIAALYRRFERRWVEKVSGTFAAAIWDPATERLMLATDRFGVRPLLFAESGGSLFFSSRLIALRRSGGLDLRIKPESIYNYLFYAMVPTPDTIFRGGQKLPPGHVLLWQKGRAELQSYWDIAFAEADRSQAELGAELRREIEESVGRALSDWSAPRAVGCFLSGGTDSSTVVGMVRKLTALAPRAFSIGFDVPGYNEIDYARIAARHFGAEHHEYFVTAEDTARAIELIVDEYDEPFGNASVVPTFYCARLARSQGVELMLAGDGGDELFGGNERYASDRVLALYQEIPAVLRRHVIEPLVFSFPQEAAVPLVGRARSYIRRATLPLPARYFSYNLLSTVSAAKIFTDDFLREVRGMPALDLAARYFDAAGATSDLNRQLYCDLKLVITDNDLRKVTQISEKEGLRVRYPLLDDRLATLSGTLPAKLKVRRFALRYIFKKALRDFLPPEVIAKKKHGFGLPWSAWLRTDSRLQEILRGALLDRSSLERGYFKQSFLEKLFQDTRTDPTPFSGAVAWVFMMLELWHRRHLERPLTS
jgi:asparagine synthase (glutamine-hydrolysing)